MLHWGLKWYPASRGDRYHVHDIAHRIDVGPIDVLSEGVEATIPAQRQSVSG